MAVVAGISPVFMILWFLLSANGLLLINLIGTRWDAQTADIHWDTEQKLFKSRYTTLWNFLANILIALIIVGSKCIILLPSCRTVGYVYRFICNVYDCKLYLY